MTGALRDAAKLANAALRAGRPADVDAPTPTRPPRREWRRDAVPGLVGTPEERGTR